MYVLTRPDIRTAEKILHETVYRTNDGEVIGRPGDRDIAVTLGDETFPIPSRVFYGTYEVISESGVRMVARRLLHVRIAREVISADAEYDYGASPGLVSVERGGWVYQSDEGDEGLINRERKHQSHVEVGPVEEVDHAPWSWRFKAVNGFLTFLPPLLTGLALISLEASHVKEWLANVMSGTETALLFLGMGVALWVRSKRWALKAAVNAGVDVARQFQVAAEILGETASNKFPQMTLWRAAQCPPLANPATLYSPRNVQRFAELRSHLAETAEKFHRAIAANRRFEHIGERLELLAVLLAIGGNITLLYASLALDAHVAPIELVSLWLPSLIGAFHALRNHRRTAERIPLLTDLAKQLKYVRTRLQASADWKPDEPAAKSAERESVLRFTCKIIGQYCQAELQLAMGQHPDLPF